MCDHIYNKKIDVNCSRDDGRYLRFGGGGDVGQMQHMRPRDAPDTSGRLTNFSDERRGSWGFHKVIDLCPLLLLAVHIPR